MSVKDFIFRYAIYYPAAWIQAGPLNEHLQSLRASQYWTPDRLANLQMEKLRLLVQEARTHVPYYREALGAIQGVELRNPGDLSHLPTLDKKTLQSRGHDLLTTRNLGRLVLKTTSGSTGQPVIVRKTRSAWGRELAATWRGYEWAGVRIGDGQARFWGTPIRSADRWRARLIDFTCNRHRFSAFRFDDGDLAEYGRVVERLRPRYFYGYVSMLAQFADYYRRTGKRLGFQLKCIIATSEVLTDHNRALLRDVFGCPVYNEYGCGELGTVAHECETGCLHLSDENMLTEILDGERPCGPGEMGEVVVTELNNLGMPLIRYRTGDFASFGRRSCACGRGLRTLEGLHGRAYDMIVNQKGQRFHGEAMMYIFEEIKRMDIGVEQFQIVQTSPDSFLARVVPGQRFTEDSRNLIVKRIRELIDAEAIVTFETVSRISREASGKMRLVVGLKPTMQGE